MTGFTITITDAGRAALINAQNNGSAAFILSQIGVASQAVTTPLAALTALPNETKRLATMAGDVVADDTLHVTIRDETTDAYALRAFGIYTDTGVLFAVYSQADPIIEKSAAAMLLLAVDARLLTLDTDQIEFGPVGFTLPPATETLAGISEVATDAEADAGTDNWRYITPRLLKRALSALSGFAAIGHKHDAADVETGTFHVSRIPELAMSKITGLVAALGAKADAVHSHGVAAIAGLSDALAGKAASVHQHAADDIVSGVLAVARIPSLAMDKITGLAAALATKATLGVNNVFRDVIAGRDALTGVYYFGTDAGRWLAYSNNRFELVGLGGLTVNGYPVFTTQNFDPNSKANIYAPTFGGLITTPNVAIRADASTWRSLKFFSGDAERHGFMMDTQAENAASAGGNLLYYLVRNDGVTVNMWQGERASGRMRYFATPHVNGADVFHGGNIINAAQYRANTGTGAITPATVWSAAEIQTITQDAILTVNLGTGLNFTTVMTGNRTLGAPSNAKPGQSGVIQIWQDGTGGRTLTFDSAWKFANGLVPQLSTAANARDVLVFTVIASGDVVASLMKDVRR